jgi:hypothetical protein
VELEAALASVQSTYGRLIARGKVPAKAVVKLLSDEHLDAVLALHMTAFDCDVEVARQRLLGQADEYNYSRQHSTVLLLNAEVIGTFLFFTPRPPETIFAYGLVVTPRWRGTWASVLLKRATFQHLEENRIKLLELRAAMTATDTHQHVKRIGGTVLCEE